MGRNLALNIAEHGFRPVVYDREPEVAAAAPGRDVATMAALADALARPRRILLMVKAGQPVDDVIDSLRAHLEPGDVIIDGGNSHWMDTARRAEALADDGIMLLGAGISGGEEGARHGPAIMAGGDERAWEIAAPVLGAIAAEVGGEPCCGRFGPGGAGHFVKMVHNGIEYAVMQAIAEAWVMLRDLAGLDAAAASAVFARWNDGPLGSYLVEITADILATPDALADGALIDKVDDIAGHKGTGRWTGEAALALGVPAPTLLSGFMARALSADTEARGAAPGRAAGAIDLALDDLQAALRATTIIAYGEGFRLLQAASDAHDWELDLAAVAGVWRGGCILRARLLEPIAEAYEAMPDLPFLAAAMPRVIASCEAGWRGTVATAASSGVSLPVTSAALGAYDALRAPSLWTSLVQAQRDRFGAHGYRRSDREGDFHSAWAGDG
jgi:6-phosphogluconate dehydrogenase